MADETPVARVKFECQDGNWFNAKVSTEDGSPLHGVKSFTYRVTAGEIATGLIECHAGSAEFTDRWVPEAQMLRWKRKAMELEQQVADLQKQLAELKGGK
jgi:hypothetical protein